MDDFDDIAELLDDNSTKPKSTIKGGFLSAIKGTNRPLDVKCIII